MVAVETDDAPGDAEANAEEAERLAQFIVYGAFAAVVEHRPRRAIAAGNIARAIAAQAVPAHAVKAPMARPDCQ